MSVTWARTWLTVTSEEGFTLMEVLVTMVILGVGLLSVAGLQMKALGGSHQASVRSQATTLAAGMADRMRANPIGTKAGDYDGQPPPDKDPGEDCHENPCSPPEMARYDAWQWKDKLETRLPGGAGHICRDTSPRDGEPGAESCTGNATDPYAIKVWWHAQEASQRRRLVFSFRGP